jgi:hypothetical protein
VYKNYVCKTKQGNRPEERAMQAKNTGHYQDAKSPIENITPTWSTIKRDAFIVASRAYAEERKGYLSLVTFGIGWDACIDWIQSFLHTQEGT